MNAIGHRAAVGPQPPTPWQTEILAPGIHPRQSRYRVSGPSDVGLARTSVAGTSILVLVTNGGFPTQLSRQCAARAMAGLGHEERFPSPRLSAGCGFRKETIAGTRRNGRDAPNRGIPTSVNPAPQAAHGGLVGHRSHVRL